MSNEHGAKSAESEMEAWSRSFVDWAKSPFGFYADQYYDAKRGVWVKKSAPVQFDIRQERVLRWVFTLREDDRLPINELWWFDIGKSYKTGIQAALAQWFGMFVDTNAEIQLAANSRDHAGIRAYKALTDSVTFNPRGHLISEWIKEEFHFIQHDEDGNRVDNVLRPVPSRAASVSGGNPIFRAIDEIWAYEGERAKELVNEIKESPTRNLSFMLVTSYPPFEDTDGPANDTINAFFEAEDIPREGIEKIEGLEDLPFYVDLENGVGVWWNHEPYAWHLRKNSEGKSFLQRQREKPGTSYQHYLRIWEARRTQRLDSFMPMLDWEKCLNEDLRPFDPQVNKKEPVVLAVDIGIKRDRSFVVGRAWDSIRYKMPLRLHKMWNPKDYAKRDKIDVVSDVKEYVFQAHRDYNVLACVYDPSQFQGPASDLKKMGVNMVEFTQNNERTAADTAYRGYILARIIENYEGADDLGDHVRHAVARELGNGTIRLDKRKVNSPIDGAVTDSMCTAEVEKRKAEFERLAKRGNRPPALTPRPIADRISDALFRR